MKTVIAPVFSGTAYPKGENFFELIHSANMS